MKAKIKTFTRTLMETCYDKGVIITRVYFNEVYADRTVSKTGCLLNSGEIKRACELGMFVGNAHSLAYNLKSFLVTLLPNKSCGIMYL